MPSNNYQDDPTILNVDILLRRIPLQPGMQIVWDANLNQWRPSSAAFKDHPNGSPMSIALLTVLDSMGLPAQHALSGYEATHVLASLTAGVARGAGQLVAPEPLPSDPAHGIVSGEKTKSVRKKLANASSWVVTPKLDPPAS